MSHVLRLAECRGSCISIAPFPPSFQFLFKTPPPLPGAHLCSGQYPRPRFGRGHQSAPPAANQRLIPISKRSAWARSKTVRLTHFKFFGCPTDPSYFLLTLHFKAVNTIGQITIYWP
jgi:hypothetical protein